MRLSYKQVVTKHCPPLFWFTSLADGLPDYWKAVKRTMFFTLFYTLRILLIVGYPITYPLATVLCYFAYRNQPNQDLSKLKHLYPNGNISEMNK